MTNCLKGLVTHKLRMSSVVFSSIKPSCILKCETEYGDRISVLIDEDSQAFTPGTDYIFFGEISEGKYGPQIKADGWQHVAPTTPRAAINFLSRTCMIPEPVARRIVTKYKGDAIQMVANGDLMLAHDKLVSSEVLFDYAAVVRDHLAQLQAYTDVWELVAGKGFAQKSVNAIVNKYERKSAQVIRRNPFRLLVDQIPGVGFKRADELYISGGHNPLSLKRRFLALWAGMRDDHSGSVWFQLDNLKAKCTADLIADGIPFDSESINKTIKLGCRSNWLRSRTVDGVVYLATRDDAEIETGIAKQIARLRAVDDHAPSQWPTQDVAESEGPSDHQKSGLLAALQSRIGILLGGPGTGKTYSVAYLVKALQKYGCDVACIAPTGKAAVRMGESLRACGVSGINPETIHRMLGCNGLYDSNGGRFLPDRFFVVDESSMLDNDLMYRFLRACSLNSHILFVGDLDQLPPVGRGAPLRDLVAHGASVGRLSEVRRNSGMIVQACKDIRDGNPIKFAESFNLDCEYPENIRIIDCPACDIVHVINQVLSSITRWDKIDQCQIVTPMNDKGVSKNILNRELKQTLNPSGRTVGNYRFAVGDKIVCKTNGDTKTVDPTFLDADGGTVYIANGEIGRVLDLNNQFAIVDFSNGKTVQIPPASNDYDLAYALSVHKSQGSEWPFVICVIDPAAGSVADLNYWYTAISRGKQACLLVGPVSAFEKQRSRKSIDRRKTFLREILAEIGDMKS